MFEAPPIEFYSKTKSGDEIRLQTHCEGLGFATHLKFGDKVQTPQGERFVLGAYKIPSRWWQIFEPDISILLLKDKDSSPTLELIDDKKYNYLDQIEVLKSGNEALVEFYNTPVISQCLAQSFELTAQKIKDQRSQIDQLTRWLKSILLCPEIQDSIKIIYLTAFLNTYKQIAEVEIGPQANENNFANFLTHLLMHMTQLFISLLADHTCSDTEIHNLLKLNCFILELLPQPDINKNIVQKTILERKIELSTLQLSDQKAFALYTTTKSAFTKSQQHYLLQFTALALQHREDLKRSMRIPTSLYAISRTGQTILLNTDCKPFGLKFGDRVNTNKGLGIVMGIGAHPSKPDKKSLWLKLDNEDAISTWPGLSGINRLAKAALTLKTTDLHSITHFFNIQELNPYLAKTLFQSFIYYLNPLKEQNLNELLSCLYQIVIDPNISDDTKMIYLTQLNILFSTICASYATEPDEKPIYEKWRNAKIIEFYGLTTGAIEFQLIDKKFSSKFLAMLFDLLHIIESSPFYQEIATDVSKLKAASSINLEELMGDYLADFIPLLFTQTNQNISTEELQTQIRINYFLFSRASNQSNYQNSVKQTIKRLSDPTTISLQKLKFIYPAYTSNTSDIEQKQYLYDLVLTCLHWFITDNCIITSIKKQMDVICYLIQESLSKLPKESSAYAEWRSKRTTEFYGLCTGLIHCWFIDEDTYVANFLQLFELLHDIEKSPLQHTATEDLKSLKTSFRSNITTFVQHFFPELLSQLLKQTAPDEELIRLLKINFYLFTYIYDQSELDIHLKTAVRKTEIAKNGLDNNKPLTLIESSICIQRIKDLFANYQPCFTQEQQQYISLLIQSFPIPVISDQTDETKDWNRWSIIPSTQTNDLQMFPLEESNAGL